MASARPSAVTLFAYQVGFGDCFLLRFVYPRFNRHVLIDFGTFRLPKGAPSGYMKRVAEDIKSQCGGKLDAVVATHRHLDHVSGFATTKSGTGSGDVIASCDPDVVVQPWTEDPRARPNAKRPTKVLSRSKAFVAALHDMHRLAGAVQREAAALRVEGRRTLANELEFLGGNGIGNRSAVENLMRMSRGRGKTAAYVHFGTKSGLDKVLPGVKIHVLGPPTLEQEDEIQTQADRDSDEFWHLQADAAVASVRSQAKLFPRALSYDDGERPSESRWSIRRLKAVRGRELLQIVREMDDALNNTSVILLFEVGKKRLLFPGDAQIENWRYALNQPKVRELLAKVDLYKVGHHGSLNATPKTMWNLFKRRSPKKRAPDRLRTVVSTMFGPHGKVRNKTEVPRRTLVAELDRHSHFLTTETLKGKAVQCHQIDIPV